MKVEDVAFEQESLETKSDYEKERNKPIPNKLHSLLQNEITFRLRQSYDNDFDFFPELSLDTTPGSTPDVCIYPKGGKLIRAEITAKESEMPITAIEILSPSQSLNDLTSKARRLYFPKGVKSVWIVVPEFKAIHVMLPGDVNHYFDSGMLKDPATDIEISIDKIFERVV